MEIYTVCNSVKNLYTEFQILRGGIEDNSKINSSDLSMKTCCDP